jgi:hypothetical protein
MQKEVWLINMIVITLCMKEINRNGALTIENMYPMHV